MCKQEYIICTLGVSIYMYIIPETFSSDKDLLVVNVGGFIVNVGGFIVNMLYGSFAPSSLT